MFELAALMPAEDHYDIGLQIEQKLRDVISDLVTGYVKTMNGIGNKITLVNDRL